MCPQAYSPNPTSWSLLQVRPSQQLAVAQRLLQERLLQKRGGEARTPVHLEERREGKEGKVVKTEGSSRPLRRERKLRKTKIFHIRPEAEGGGREWVEEREGCRGEAMPELTITRNASPRSSPPPSPLDLSTPRPPTLAPPSPPPFLPSPPSLSLVLRPADYEALAPLSPLYQSYISLPSIGLFVHPLAIPTQLQQGETLAKPTNPAPPNLPLPSPPTALGKLQNYSNNNNTMVATQRTVAGGGATFCTFKNVKNVNTNKNSPPSKGHLIGTG